MSLTTTLQEHIAACFTGIWITTSEPSEALREITVLAHDEQWRLLSWDIEKGLQGVGTQTASSRPAETPTTDPLEALHLAETDLDPNGTTLLVLHHFHRFLQSPEIIQTLLRLVESGKQTRLFLIILAPSLSLPAELEKQWIVFHHALPERTALEEIARAVATEEGEFPEESLLAHVLDAAAGLTRYEAEGAFALSLIRSGTLQPEVIWNLKAQALQKDGALKLYRGRERFENLGGLNALKDFCRRLMLRQGDADVRLRPRGVLLLSPPGCGKSAFAKALGNETQRPTLLLDIGALMGSLVGQTEQNLRKALSQIEAMAPCVVMIDEVEKALSGVNGGNDSGVSARLFGTLLTWLNDHESDVFVICTCNEIAKLPPEFTRAERFDGIFFVDLPGPRQRRQIWTLYRAFYDLDPAEPLPNDTDWTGAEIKSCCRLARLLEVPLIAAAQQVVPIAMTANQSITTLRQWASGRCLDAELPEVYVCGHVHVHVHVHAHDKNPAAKPGRKVRRVDPLSN